MALSSSENTSKDSSETERPRKRRFFECLYVEQPETKFSKIDNECASEEAQHVSSVPREALRKSLESLHEYQGWLHRKEREVKDNLFKDKRLTEKDSVICNLKKHIEELETRCTTSHDVTQAQESEAVKNLLSQIKRLQEENDGLRNETNHAMNLERRWASKYWKLYETDSEKDAKISKLEFEHTEKDSQIRKLNRENERLLLQLQSCQEERVASEEILRGRLHNMRGELNEMRTELFEDKISHLEFMAAYKPMVIIENSKKTLIDMDRYDELNTQLCSIKRIFLHLKQKATDLSDTSQNMIAETSVQIQNAIRETNSKYNELFPRYKREIELRKKYHNELVELRGNIRVLCRVRPHSVLPEGEDGTSCVSVDTFDDCTIKVNSKGRSQDFEFDKVFMEDTTQCQVFEEVSSLVTSVLDGFNVCIFAYGQTGSGKTYTMEGPPHNPGINQRALKLLFEKAQSSSSEYSIQASVMEVYNEVVRDLLNSDSSVKLEVKMKPEGGLHVPGLVHIPVTSLEEVNQIFNVGRRNRATEATNMNEHSSRSHCLLCVDVIGVDTLTGTKSLGRLNLVDLAGSERVSKSLAEGPRLKEAQNINKSLSSLGDVINALKNKHSHIPYRNSKLTYLLQESLSGDSKTLMILQVSPEERDASETVCTLVFGQRVRTIELGGAGKRVEDGSGTGKGTPSSLRRGMEAATKTTTPTTSGRPQNLAKSASVWSSSKLK